MSSSLSYFNSTGVNMTLKYDYSVISVQLWTNNFVPFRFWKQAGDLVLKKKMTNWTIWVWKPNYCLELFVNYGLFLPNICCLQLFPNCFRLFPAASQIGRVQSYLSTAVYTLHARTHLTSCSTERLTHRNSMHDDAATHSTYTCSSSSVGTASAPPVCRATSGKARTTPTYVLKCVLDHNEW